MTIRRPTIIIVTLTAIAAASFAGSGLLDKHRNWGDAQQAAANALWIAFLVALLALAVTGVGLLRRRTGRGHLSQSQPQRRRP